MLTTGAEQVTHEDVVEGLGQENTQTFQVRDAFGSHAV